MSSKIARVLALTLLPVCGVTGLPEPEHADVPRIGYLQVSELGNQLKEDFRAGLRDLRGAAPGNLPIPTGTNVELVIRLGRSTSMPISPAVVARATSVIE